jgi:hypothetical protein
MMDASGFVSYLQDHLAASEAGSKIVTSLRRSNDDDNVGEVMTRFEQEFGEEQQVLRTVIDRLGGGSAPSITAQVFGLAGSIVAIARRIVVAEPAPSLLEELESLAVGVWAKRLLWGAIARRASEDPRLADIAIDRLIEMAESQEIELLRLRDAELATLAA